MCDHRAAFAKLGYLYQIRYALYRAIEDTDAYFIKLESLDDVEVKKKTEHELFQLKHHTVDKNLTNKSVDLWKTIGIWSEQILNESVEQDDLVYYLATTAKIPDKSIASLLTTKNRDVEKAIELLNTTAKEINNKKLTDSVSKFSKLTSEQKGVMCKSIFILGGEDDSDEIVNKIKSRLELTVSSDCIDNLYERLEGWWFNIVILFLLGKTDKIWRNEVVQKVIELSYDYHPDSLPVDFEELEMKDDERDGFLDYQFVKQLELIGVGTERIHNAILDYYRAYAQRSKWVTDDLSIEHDVVKYERKLKDDWSRFRLSIIDELEDADEKEIKKAGRTILNWVETQADIRIRKKVSQRFIMLGSYHILANKKPPSLGWHPYFKKKLEEILTSSEASHAN
ncbi:hypothetical protein CGJ29_19960 [Vibrio parahaemolyticus]|uniref:ABC-three component system protein n=1 Tax=Vibrio parahaemolyticus TaxID=670 RepID=UPI00111F4A67|nr:ABC-three component system protein [Vibrio parahaemolyticus]TOF05470.1 hypothetical protein CGJ29_19960 [Vibrio parahaemolyticus]